MIPVVGVRFKASGKIYYFDPKDTGAQKDMDVIVETSQGMEYGQCVIGPKEIEESEMVLPLREVIRLATPEDKRKLEESRGKEESAREICLEKIQARGLEMKLVGVEYSFDGSKIIFFFTAEGRVDFRELVKDLAAVFKTRIELRQIGVRDEAKMIGGLGCCGRELCCATFLGDFAPVSIKMAKEQNLSLNPGKISGICGRLMCCLKYESYEDDEDQPKCPGYQIPEDYMGEEEGKELEEIASASTRKKSEASENLDQLYKEGFHICHQFYGKPRKGECIFCRGIIEEYDRGQ